MATTTLSRSTGNGLIAGVCAGIARRFGISAWLVRAIFIASCLIPGPQFIIYIALWVLLPKD